MRFLILSLAFVFAAPALAQDPGEVLWASKINFQAPNDLGLAFADQFGRSVDVIGDLDNDGIDELIVGASHSNDAGMPDSGAIWILFMNADATVRVARRIGAINGGLVGPLDAGDQFGKGVGAIGDLDGDGIPDVAVGAPKDADGGQGNGAVYILFLNADGTVKAEQKISDTEGGFTGTFTSGWAGAGDEFGRSIVRLGDMDGDGVTELAVGSSNYRELGDGTYGVMFILFMNADGTVKSHTRIDQSNGGFDLSNLAFFGISADNVGDWDGDGVNDLMVGASHDSNAGPTWAGSVFLFLLNADGTVKDTTLITEGFNGFDADLETSDQFGREIAFLGDVDGDGTPDIAVGASEDDDGGQNAADSGAIYVLFMNSDRTVREYQKISNLAGRLGFQLGNHFEFGISCASLGDFNGDSVPDLVVGARFDTGRGAIYMLMLNDGNQAPATAYFSASPLLGPQPLVVQFTDESTGNISAWSWDFGDGGSSSEQTPEYTYDTPGTYTVSMTASGTGGVDTRIRADLITVQSPLPPVVALTAAPTSGPAPLDVSFTDLSTGLVTSWSWAFGDGDISTDANPMHTYMSPGDFSVTLTATGPGGSDMVTLNDLVSVSSGLPPVAEFAGAPLAGEAPLDVAFSDLSTGGVTSWSWDFGDGEMSIEESPLHQYETPGEYSVTLTVTGPGGTDAMAKTDYVSVVAPGPPIAAWSAAPQLGFAPLVVTFNDLSTGAITAWSWSFGDGASSNEASPVHQYTTVGPKDVTLTVMGPGGSDILLMVGAVSVLELEVGELEDPSFEVQVHGGPPSTPWTVFGGSENVVRSSGDATDNAMPIEGLKWLEISAEGTVDSTPPAAPGGETQPAVGGAGVSQPFVVVDGRTEISFQAAFLLAGDPELELFNDWMSVDVSDGTTTHNLYYRDSFSALTRTSEIHGLPMTKVDRVSVDLAKRFPDLTGSTVLTLSVQVGNGGDGLAPSLGYVDDIRFAAPIVAVQRYGCGLNPVDSLTVLSGTPSVGTSFVLGLDNPLGTQGPNSTSVLFVCFSPDANYPCGTPLPGFGMAGGGANGELLVNLIMPDPIVVLVGEQWSTPGVPAAVAINIPANPSLVDLDIYLQGYIRDDAQTFGLRIGLTDAYRVTLGQ